MVDLGAVVVGHCKGCLTFFAVQPDSELGTAYCCEGCETGYSQRVMHAEREKTAAYNNPTGTKDTNEMRAREVAVDVEMDMGAFQNPTVDPAPKEPEPEAELEPEAESA